MVRQTLIVLVAAFALSGCTMMHARSALEAAQGAVGSLAAFDDVTRADVVMMQTTLEGVRSSLADPSRVDFWIAAFLHTTAGVVGSLQSHGVDVPDWVGMALKGVAAFCQSLCVLEEDEAPSPIP